MLTIGKKISLKQNYSIIVGQNKQKEDSVSRNKILFSFYAIFQRIAVSWNFMHDYKQIVSETFDIQYNLHCTVKEVNKI